MSENGIYIGIQLIIILIILGVLKFTENYYPNKLIKTIRISAYLSIFCMIYYNIERIINKIS